MRIREVGEKGITLIELMVAVLILGILMAIAVPVFANQTRATADGMLVSNLSAINSSISTYRTTERELPSSVSKAAVIDKDMAVSIVKQGDDYCLLGVVEGGTYTKANPFIVVNGLTVKESGICPFAITGAVWEK